jgi:hypothetical protein
MDGLGTHVSLLRVKHSKLLPLRRMAGIRSIHGSTAGRYSRALQGICDALSGDALALIRDQHVCLVSSPRRG